MSIDYIILQEMYKTKKLSGISSVPTAEELKAKGIPGPLDYLTPAQLKKATGKDKGWTWQDMENVIAKGSILWQLIAPYLPRKGAAAGGNVDMPPANNTNRNNDTTTWLLIAAAAAAIVYIARR